MGKKINPLGLRLGTIQSHRSIWFAQSKSYSKSLQEDEKIQYCIYNHVEKNRIISSGLEGKGISHIEIQKKMDLIQVIIYVGSKNYLMESRTRGIDELQTNIQKNEFISVSKRLNIAIIRVAKPYAQPTILAEHIALQLKNRVSFRKAMKSTIELTEQADTKGIQIQIAGRIDGKEIARVEWIREGRVPLQTLRAKIDYCSYPVRTIYGVLGIKIWMFFDEK